MDKFDKAILELLSQNARQPVASIGEAIGLSRTAVNDRIRKLEDKGVIQRYTIELGKDQQTSHVNAYFELTFRPFDLVEIKRLLRMIPEIKQAHALSGVTDVLLYVEAHSMERLSHVRCLLSDLPNLEKVITSTAFERIV
ncbi:Lrp/AsnC family transcriptional regulator [Marinomonas sp. 15G1-11]|uniref:Lrp/AsnC family transcriptional regulator n=1 Tax=Marinomonas phaeophyticola TaxID=3004091 RepID=A0ABT4JRD7_9GAMM|nr:Lrp/AsnC family transcriptional regulator [Marinomonas sp. 15G1-11]MCZ2720164.1 Lrp/AsnC family transcriptional regulator [Marinomonas sp. 15G1-11]